MGKDIEKTSKIKQLLSKFTAATIKAAMADRPEIMQSSGWFYDNDGMLIQGDPNTEGPTRLRRALTAASLSALSGAAAGSGIAPIISKNIGTAVNTAGRAALPSTILNRIGLASVSPFADAAAESYWFAKAGQKALRDREEGKNLSAGLQMGLSLAPLSATVLPRISRGLGNVATYSRLSRVLYSRVAGLQAALKRGDYVIAPSSESADWFMKNYKTFYPGFMNSSDTADTKHMPNALLLFDF